MEALDRELENLKQQRAENWREMNRMKDQNEGKAKDQAQQTERIKAMDYDLART